MLIQISVARGHRSLHPKPHRARQAVPLAKTRGQGQPTPKYHCQFTQLSTSIKQLDDAITKPHAALTPAFVTEASTELARCGVAIARTDELPPEEVALLLPDRQS